MQSMLTDGTITMITSTRLQNDSRTFAPLERGPHSESRILEIQVPWVLHQLGPPVFMCGLQGFALGPQGFALGP